MSKQLKHGAQIHHLSLQIPPDHPYKVIIRNSSSLETFSSITEADVPWLQSLFLVCLGPNKNKIVLVRHIGKLWLTSFYSNHTIRYQSLAVLVRRLGRWLKMLFLNAMHQFFNASILSQFLVCFLENGMPNYFSITCDFFFYKTGYHSNTPASQNHP